MVPEQLMRELDVRLNSPVVKIAPASREGLYEVHVGGENPRSYLAEGVILAVPLPLVINIVDGLPEDLLEGFRRVRYAPSIVTALAVDREYPATSMINNLLRKDDRVVATVIFDHHKSPQRVPKGKSLITAILCEPASRMLFAEPDGKITEAVLEDVGKLYPGFADTLIFSKVYRWPHGAVQLMPGSVRQQHRMRKRLRELRGNLLFAGDGLYKSSLEISFNTGVEAANRMIENPIHGFGCVLGFVTAAIVVIPLGRVGEFDALSKCLFYTLGIIIFPMLVPVKSRRQHLEQFFNFLPHRILLVTVTFLSFGLQPRPQY